MESSVRTLAACCVRRLAFAPVALVLAANAVTAQDAPCAAVPQDEYRLAVIKDVPMPRLNHRLKRSALGDLTFHGRRESILGLTRSQLEVVYEAAFRSMPVGEAFCFWTAGVTVTLRYNTLDVYVAAEYAVGSCPYNAILSHERQHVAVAHRYLDYYTPNIKSALTSLTIPKAQTPALVTSFHQAQAETLDRIGELLQPAVETMRGAMMAAQAALDTPNAYRTVRGECSNW